MSSANWLTSRTPKRNLPLGNLIHHSQATFTRFRREHQSALFRVESLYTTPNFKMITTPFGNCSMVPSRTHNALPTSRNLKRNKMVEKHTLHSTKIFPGQRRSKTESTILRTDCRVYPGMTKSRKDGTLTSVSYSSQRTAHHPRKAHRLWLCWSR